VESLTTRLETAAAALLEEIDRLGGMWKCLESGWLRQQFDRTTTEIQGEINERQRLIVGANAFQGPDGPISRAIVDGAYKVPSDEKRFGAIERVRQLRQTRDAAAVQRRLGELAAAVREGRNIVRSTIEAAKVYATLGEMVGTIRMAHGLPFDPYARISAPQFLQVGE
jgi:methylmalonyl-CoA mutase N-terminal domain/subunit